MGSGKIAFNQLCKKPIKWSVKEEKTFTLIITFNNNVHRYAMIIAYLCTFNNIRLISAESFIGRGVTIVYGVKYVLCQSAMPVLANTLSI